MYRLLPFLILALTVPALTWAADDETTRLEIAALCQAMPYRCPKGAKHATQKDLTTTNAPPPPVKTSAPAPRVRKPPQPTAQPMPASPPLTAHPAPSVGRDADGWPTPQNAAQSLVTECARASGIAPTDTLTLKQVRDLTTCVDIIRMGLYYSK